MTDDDVIAQYRTELASAAEIAARDLDEIEDHLRTLADGLRANGMPYADAIREACRRLGEPKALAREHARVRSPFGVKLSRARAWSAAVLLAPTILIGLQQVLWYGLASPRGAIVALDVVMLAALAARLSWARSILLGAHVFALIGTLSGVFTGAVTLPVPALALLLGRDAAVLVFLVPWRRGELTPAALALALLSAAYFGAMATAFFFIHSHRALENPAGVIAFVAAIAAAAGLVMRARWAALAAAITAVALVPAAITLANVGFAFPHGAAIKAHMLVEIGVGALAAAIVAVMSWRTARTRFGTLRHVLD